MMVILNTNAYVGFLSGDDREKGGVPDAKLARLS